MVRAGKTVSIILAVIAILTAPLVAGAPDGLYDLLQQLNGIFFIPIASVMLAGIVPAQNFSPGSESRNVCGACVLHQRRIHL